MLRQAVGHGGEVGSSIWKSCSFNHDTEQWELEWPEEKTGNANLMTFTRDATNFEIDVFHSMAAYLTVFEGRLKRNEDKYLFPCFANMRKGGASEKVNGILKKCVGKVDGITADMTPSGIRVAATDEMVFCEKINDIVAIMRGGWYFDGESRMYYYVTKRCHVSKGGVVLGNHKDPNRKVPLYPLDPIINDSNKDRIQNYMHQLLGKSSPNTGILHKYFLASLIYWYEDFNLAYSTNNVVTQRMLTVGNKFLLKHDTFLAWSRLLRKDLSERSIVPMEKFTDIACCMENIQKQMASLATEVRETKAEVAYLRKENAELRVLIEEMHALMIGKKMEGLHISNLSSEHAEGSQEGDKVSSNDDGEEPEKKRKRDAMQLLKEGQMRAASETHFDSCLNWDVKKFIFEVVVEKHAVGKAKTFPRDRKKQHRLARAWTEIIGECNAEEREYLTLRRAVPSPDSAAYKYFCDKMEQIAADVEERVFKKNMIMYKEVCGKDRTRQTCRVAALTYLLDDIAKKLKAKK